MSKNLETKEVDLEQVIQLLQKQNEELLKENEVLRCKIIALEDKLNINSGNSGLPMSREIFQIEKKTRVKNDRKAGGQPNHKYNSYQMKKADVIVDVMPCEESCKCGGILTLAEEYKLHQKVEIPVIQPVVTEYHLRQKICASCNKRYKGKLNNYKLLGKNAEGIIGSLGGFFNNSKRDIQQILSQIFNLDLSLGLISTSEGRIDKLRYLRIMKKINERMLYYLTTILNINGCEHARRVAKNILKSFDMMWMFVDNLEIEPTNNHAERQIKHHVKYRKNSFFTWSTRGDRFLERAKSIFASSKLQCLNPFQELINQLS